MSWPIGYAAQGLRFTATRDGGVAVDGERLTDSDGWLEVHAPRGCRLQGAPPSIHLRLRLSLEPCGRTFLFAEEVYAAGRRFSSVYAFALHVGESWMSCLHDAVHAAITVRSTSSVRRRWSGTMPTVSGRAVQPHAANDAHATAARDGSDPRD